MKDTVYMDLDDTFVDTENFLRKVLVNCRLYIPKGYSVYAMRGNDDYADVIEKVMHNYTMIPLKAGALNCLQLLDTEYKVKFCSVYYTEAEREGKEEFAKQMNKPIVLLNKDEWTKETVNMSDGVIVDDSLKALQLSNAKVRIQMFNPFVAQGLSYKDYLVGDAFAENLYDVVDYLLGGKPDENLRRNIRVGV